MRVSDKQTFNRLNIGFARGLFEASNGPGEWNKLKADEQEYARNAYTIEDVDMSSLEEEEYSDEEPEPEPQVSESEEEEEEEHDSDSDESENGNVKPVAKGKNSQLAVGYRNGLSFVVRGDMIGVFRTAEDGKKLKFSVNINGLSTPDGKRMFEPAKVRGETCHSAFADGTCLLYRSCFTSKTALWSCEILSTPMRFIA